MKHEWLTYENSEDIDTFALSVDHHNGPQCVKCGKKFCHHCTPDCYDEECEGD